MNSYIIDDYKITELSYFEYKNLIKNIMSVEDNKVVDIFEKVIDEHVIIDRPLHIGDKIKILFLLRSMTLGEKIELEQNGKKFSYDVNEIIESITYENEKFKYKSMVFDIPKKIFYKSKFECLIDNFYSFELNDEVKIVTEYTYKQKEIILQNLIGFETKELTNKFNEYLSNFYLKYIDKIQINLYDSNLLIFLKGIFETNLNEMYDIEYSLMTHLKYSPLVFNMYGLPELRIFLNKFIKEKEESKKRDSGNTNPTI
tara:strand:- start:641 stop:1411 length:771 start_codon:yes stop_codon:yes gene_type:complete